MNIVDKKYISNNDKDKTLSEETPVLSKEQNIDKLKELLLGDQNNTQISQKKIEILTESKDEEIVNEQLFIEESHQNKNTESKVESQNTQLTDSNIKKDSTLEPDIQKELLPKENTKVQVASSKIPNKVAQPIAYNLESQKDISFSTEAKKDYSFKLRKLFSEIKFRNNSLAIKTSKISIFLKVFIFFFVICFSYLVYCLWDLPDYKLLSSYNPPLTTRVFSSDGYILSEYAVEKRSYVFINDIPAVVKEAFISAEDKNFYKNYGFDFAGMLRSLWNDMLYLLGKSNNITGASTITQQVVKNLLLTKERTIRRKIREAVLTFQLERSFSKDHILELYLNAIYLGNGSYGVATAALNYFGKPVTDLDLAEAAYLASIPKAPSRYNPITRNKFAVTRRNWVINRMLIDGKIKQNESLEAQKEPLIVKERKNLDVGISSYAAEEVRRNLLDKFGYDVLYNEGLSVQTSIDNKFQKYAYDSLRWGINRYEMKKGYTGAAFSALGNNITQKYLLDHTDSLPNWYIFLHAEKKIMDFAKIVAPWEIAIVLNVQKDKIKVGLSDNTTVILNREQNLWAAPYDINNINRQLENFNDILKIGDVIFVEQQNNQTWQLRQIPKVNGAIVVMNPQNGQILAMQGGYSYLLSQFNRATQAKRQLGSAFKPFVYLSAFEKGFKSSDLFLDAPFVSRNDTLDWKPQNNANSYSGLITMRRALEVSKNLATIRIGSLIGLDYISQLSKRLGLYDSNLNNLSNLLGSKETTLINTVRAFSILVNGGKDIQPNIIEMIQDNEGKVKYKNDNRECDKCNNIEWNDQNPPLLEDNRKSLVDPKDAYLIVNLMQGVVQRGSGRYARIKGYNIGGKTGTTNDDKDTWFIGFTPDLIVGIYVGADVPVSLGKDLQSSTIAVPIFYNFMNKALKDREQLPFRIPEGIHMYWVDYTTGKASLPSQPNSILEVFKDDQVPDKEDLSQKEIFQRDKTSNKDINKQDNGIW